VLRANDTRFFNTGFLRLISCRANSPPWSYSLYEAIIVKLIFDLFHLLVRPAGDYLVVPT